MTTNLGNQSPEELEHLVADIWTHRGWTTSVTSSGRDGGVDVTAERQNPFPEKQLIQVKHYPDGSVSAPEVQQYAGLQHQHSDADTVVIATSGEFTSPARETAREANVKLVDGTELTTMADDANLLDTSSSASGASLGPPPGSRDVASDGGDRNREESRGPLSDQVADAMRVVFRLIVFGLMMYVLWDAGLFPI